MAKAPSDETRLRQNRGTGTGADYITWIKSREFGSMGVSTSYPDYKTGRNIELLSRGELYFYLLLRWNDNVSDIREQFPLLPLKETTEIAKELGMTPSYNGRKVMTTDMLVTKTDGSEFALSVKASKNDVTPRQMELMAIEQEYWKRRGVPYVIGYKDHVNEVEVRNIRDCTDMYDIREVRDEIGLVRHLIARKHILVDMTKKIDYREILEKLKDTELWKNSRQMLELC